jgi:ferric-dicitrate binding protein FerR (iron transport regulator)
MSPGEHTGSLADGASPGATGDAIARLLRLAGPRPSVSEERAARVKTAVWSRWLEAQRARKGRARWLIGVLATAAGVVVAMGVTVRRPVSSVSPTPAVPVARLEAAFGSVAQVLRPGATDLSGLGVGGSVIAGSTLLTGPEGRAALRLVTGTSLRLDVGTRLRLQAADELLLERGAVYVDNGPTTLGKASIQVHTPFGVARDIGTQFEARLGAAWLRLRVREGSVILKRGSHVETADVGTELTVGIAGGVARRPVALHGEEWDWIVGMAPAYEIEGSQLKGFLDWVSRETGWAVDFGSREVEEEARGVVLHGAIEGLAPREALAAVLPTCGLIHNVEAGHVRIEVPGSEPGLGR